MGSNVAVIGAGGATGQALCAALLSRDCRPRALVHHADSADRLPGDCAVRIVELEDAESLRRGLTDIETLCYIPPTYCPREEAFARNVLAASAGAGVGRVVYHSVLHAPTRAMPHHWRKAAVEALTRSSPLRWTILQPAMYMQTAFNFLSPDKQALTPAFDVDRPFTPVDLVDLAEATAAVLLGPTHDYATYELAGAETLTFRDMAAEMGRVFGHPVVVRALPTDAVIEQARPRFGAEALDELRLMMEHYDDHGLVGNGNVLRMILGREPARFADAVRRLN